MKKLIVILATLLFSTFCIAQTDTTKCLFSFVSQYEDNFNAAVDYMKSFGVDVIATCDEECLILVRLEGKYINYEVLFAKIERAFEGKCYYKSRANVILSYEKCYDIYIKEKNE